MWYGGERRGGLCRNGCGCRYGMRVCDGSWEREGVVGFERRARVEVVW